MPATIITDRPTATERRRFSGNQALRLSRSLTTALIAAVTLVAHALLLANEGYPLLSDIYAERDTRAAERVIDSAISRLPLLAPELTRHSADWQLYRDASTAAESFRLALSGRPIDPYLWSRYSIAELYAGNWGQGGTAARFVLNLAPNTYLIALEQAAVGGQFLEVVDKNTEKAWRRAAELAMTLRAESTQRYLIFHEREDDYCRLVAATSETRPWCEYVRSLREICANESQLSPEARQHCVRVGMLNPVNN